MSLLLSCCANWKCSPGDDAVYALNSACSPVSYSSKTAAPSKPSSYLCITPSITCACDAYTLCTLPTSWTYHVICWKQPLACIPQQYGINSTNCADSKHASEPFLLQGTRSASLAVCTKQDQPQLCMAQAYCSVCITSLRVSTYRVHSVT